MIGNYACERDDAPGIGAALAVAVAGHREPIAAYAP